MMDKQNNKEVLTGKAKVSLAIIIVGLYHLVTLIIAAYWWVWTGKKWPPFDKYEDGILLYIMVSFITLAIGGVMSGILVEDKKWKKSN